MKKSTEIVSISKICGEEKAIEYVAKAGFDAWDFSMFSMFIWDWANLCPKDNEHPLKNDDYIKFAKKLKRVADDNGIICNQSHAPFPTDANGVSKYLYRSIECTAEVGGEICVIHPHAFANPKQNAEFYNKLLPFAKEHGVKIATENMWDWDRVKNQACFAACATAKDFNDVLDEVNDEYLVACLDIGHAEMRGNDTSAYQMIKALDKRLKALHIHDNDCHHDSHQIPFSMNIDFKAVATALKEINYSGYLTLEADAYIKIYDQTNVLDGVKKMKESLDKLEELM